MKITLRAARVNKGLTQAEAADALGVNKETISSWEHSKSFPDILELRKIEVVYGVNYNDIIFLPSNTL
jgi:transcriptional regulator with XRE-family HTH domain